MRHALVLACQAPGAARSFVHWLPGAARSQYLVALQAGLTVVGNFTLWWAAYQVFKAVQAEQQRAQ
jgi:hypothetical protein